MSCTVIVVTYNSSRVIEDCLRPIAGSDRLQILVVDNDSSDATVDLVRRFPGVEFIPTGSNAGFARAVNLGALQARGDFILLLNPDAVVSEETIFALVADLQADPSVGVIAPKLTDREGLFRTVNAGREPTLWRMFLHLSGMSRLRIPGARFINAKFEGHYLLDGDAGPDRRSVDWVSGGCMLIRNDVWRETGGLSNRWFMYAEDIEFCHRVRALGWSVELDPSLAAMHEIGGSSLNVNGRVHSLWLSNLYDYYAANISRGPLSRWAWRFIVRFGYLSRAYIFGLLSRTPFGDSIGQTHNQRRFRNYASFALTHCRLREEATRVDGDHDVSGMVSGL